MKQLYNQIKREKREREESQINKYIILLHLVERKKNK